MQVIGWTESALVRHGLWRLVPAGALNLVLADIPVPFGTAERLRTMVNCYEHGLDFIPLSPATQMTEKQAAQLAAECGAALTRQYRLIAEHGQMTLLLSLCSSLPAPQPADGRAWLKARSQRLAGIDGAARMMQKIVADLSYRRHMCQAPGAIRCDLLVPRRELVKTQQHIKTAKNLAMQADGISSLTVCGLWPPFHFSALPELANA